MAEAAHILRRCTARSLLLVDEVGRGTGTLDGLSIAQAICEFLLGLEEQSPMVLFATHFHELCALAEHSSIVANYHITAVENTARGGVPVFSHRVQAGSSSRSFGIEVARMAGPSRRGDRARRRDRRSALRRARHRRARAAEQENAQTRDPGTAVDAALVTLRRCSGFLASERWEDDLRGRDQGEQADDDHRRPSDDVEERAIRPRAH